LMIRPTMASLMVNFTICQRIGPGRPEG